jgi:hypothetical protein
MPAAQACSALVRWSVVMVMAVSGGGQGGGDVAAGGDAEADMLGAAGGGQVGLGDLVVGGGEADAESFGFAGPALAFGLGDAGEEEVVADLSSRRCRRAGSMRSMGHRMQDSLN